MSNSERYSRQELFTPIGTSGQRLLSSKHVLLIGAGALGTGTAEALARAGVGKLTIVDRDYVEWSNLGRQQLYAEHDAAERMPKAVAAARRLRKINSSIDIEGIVADVAVDELMDLMKLNVDVMIDATDNFDIRMMMNDAAQKHSIPWIYGACVGSYGTTYTIIPGKTPCLSCLLSSVPIGGATCDTAGIIAPAVGMVVSHQVTEALKLLVGDVEALRSTLLSFDLWKNQHAEIKVSRMKKTSCPSCGEQRTYPYLSAQNHARTAVLCGRDTVQIRPSKPVARNLEELSFILKKQGLPVTCNPFLLSFTIGDHRLVGFKDGRVLVHGTKDIAKAKSLYHRYFG